MRALIFLVLASMLCACDRVDLPGNSSESPASAPAPTPFPVFETFGETRWEMDGGYRTGLKALSGKWIADCTFESNDFYDARSFCVLKNWAGRKMTNRPVPATRGLRIVLESNMQESRTTAIDSTEYTELPASLKCGEMVVPPRPDGRLPTIGPKSTIAITQYLRQEQCVLVFNTEAGEHAYDTNIPIEGFEGALLFSLNWITSHAQE
jgi:hypothetical protein